MVILYIDSPAFLGIDIFSTSTFGTSKQHSHPRSGLSSSSIDASQRVMATDAASSGFADHALLVEAIRALTVAQAKALIKDLNNEGDIACGHLALSGNKPEIINRLTTSLTERKNQGDIRGYQKFRALILRYKGPPVPSSYGYGRIGYVYLT